MLIVRFRHPDSAKEALQAMDGFELAGKHLKVEVVSDNRGSKSHNSLDDHETGGVRMNNISRVELMHKLSRPSDAREAPQKPSSGTSET